MKEWHRTTLSYPLDDGGNTDLEVEFTAEVGPGYDGDSCCVEITDCRIPDDTRRLLDEIGVRSIDVSAWLWDHCYARSGHVIQAADETLEAEPHGEVGRLFVAAAKADGWPDGRAY